jgi:DNA repair exonuclease SbcCD nuclease subunit
LRFLHTADWQLGMKAAHAGQAAVKIREARLHVVNKIAGLATNHAVEVVLIAGDTFEDNAVDRRLVQRVADILSGFTVPIYVIPGNHDPLLPGSVWDHPAWKAAVNIHVLREEIPVELPGAVIYPCPVKRKASMKDPTAWIPSDDSSKRIRIALAHGTVEGIQMEEPDYPIPRDAALRAGLDYLALGHWHSTTTYPGRDGVARMAYSGTHEATKFGERDSGNVLIVDVPAAGLPPEIISVHSGSLIWKQVEKEILVAGDLGRLREQVEAMGNEESTLIDLRLKGLLAVEDSDEIVRIREIISSRFLYGHMDISQLHPSPADEDWVAGLPVGIIRKVGERLQELADPAYTGERPGNASIHVASRALLELYAMVAREMK